MSYRVALLALPLVVLAGCAAVGGPESATTMRLAPGIGANTVGMPTVRVSMGPVIARGMAGDRRYTYVLAGDPRVVRQAATFFWEEAPTIVIRRSLNESLEARGMVAGDAAAQLSVTLARFEEVSDPPHSDAFVSVDVELNTKSGHQFLGTICHRVPIANASGSARAQAFEKAISAVDEDVADRVAGHAAAVASEGCS